MEVDLDGVKNDADVKVIYILDDKDPYPLWLGIDWAFYNDTVLNLKQWWMSLEKEGRRVV